MKTFELNGIDVIYWFDVEQYHKEHGDKKRVLVWHGDSIAEFVFNAIEEIPLFFCGFGLVQCKADGDFVFYDHDKIRHTVFKNSNKWKIWKEMDEYLKEHKEIKPQKQNNLGKIQQLILQQATLVDSMPKNQFLVLDETKNELVPQQYDPDMPLGGDNGLYSKEKFAWCLKHISEVTSHKAMSPRGLWFHYAALYDGHIYAIGEEQGNYAGGDIISVETKGEDAVRDYIDNYLANSNDEYDKSLYEKIKDLPVATKEMVDEMNRKFKSFEKGEEK